MKYQNLLSRIKSAELRAAASAAAGVVTDLAARRAALDSSGKFTERGRSQELADNLKKEFAPRFRQVQQPIVKAMQAIEERKNKLSVPMPDPKDIAGALDRQEIRRHILSLPMAERMKVAFETRDQRILDSILSAPPMLTGLPEDRFKQLADMVRERIHGPEMAEISEIEADIDEARMVVKVATNDLREASGLPENLFSAIVSNSGQGAVWLKRSGDQVVVIRPGETSAPLASAEDLATGKYYLSLAEYQADRPAGERYVPQAAA